MISLLSIYAMLNAGAVCSIPAYEDMECQFEGLTCEQGQIILEIQEWEDEL